MALNHCLSIPETGLFFPPPHPRTRPLSAQEFAALKIEIKIKTEREREAGIMSETSGSREAGGENRGGKGSERRPIGPSSTLHNTQSTVARRGAINEANLIVHRKPPARCSAKLRARWPALRGRSWSDTSAQMRSKCCFLVPQKGTKQEQKRAETKFTCLYKETSKFGCFPQLTS